MSESSSIDVSIMGRSYKVSCPPEERESLLQAVRYLDQKMNEIRSSGRITQPDRIAVMAALNMANELLKFRARDSGPGDEAIARVRALRERVEATLERGQQLEL